MYVCQNYEVVVVVVGYGKSEKIPANNKRNFMQKFMHFVQLERPVLVCPSMSGAYALPFLLKPDAATCTERLRGFVPIAPTGAGKFKSGTYSYCEVSFVQQ